MVLTILKNKEKRTKNPCVREAIQFISFVQLFDTFFIRLLFCYLYQLDVCNVFGLFGDIKIIEESCWREL